MQLPRFWSNPQSLWQYIRAARENVLNIIPPSSMHQPFTTFPSFMGNTHYVSDPAMLREILKDRAEDFPKSRSFQMILNPVIPTSIILSEGDKWESQHKNMIQVFNWRNIQGFQDQITEIARRYIADHHEKFLAGEDITRPIQDLTFEIIAQILLGDHTSPTLGRLRIIFEEYLDKVIRIRMTDAIELTQHWFPSMRKLTERKVIREFFEIGDKLISERLAAPKKPKEDFLEHLLDAFDYRNDPTPEKANEIRDNLVTFIVAGHETTAMTLAWALYAIADFPDAQAKIAAEADATDLRDMPFTESFIQETMRLFPAAPMILRVTTDKTTVGDLQMKKGEGIIIPILALHRHRDHWEHPDEFLPERFTGGFKPAPYTYMPFGAGPRICIGAALAMMEGKIILAELMRNVKVAPSDHIPEAIQTLTMRSKNGIRLNISPRVNIPLAKGNIPA